MESVKIDSPRILRISCGNVHTSIPVYSILKMGAETTKARVVRSFAKVRKKPLEASEVEVINVAIDGVFNDYVLNEETTVIITSKTDEDVQAE